MAHGNIYNNLGSTDAMFEEVAAGLANEMFRWIVSSFAPNLAVSWQMLAPLEQSFVEVRRNGPGTSGNLGLVPVYLVKARYISPMPPSVALSDLRKTIDRIVRPWRPLSSERFNRVTGDGWHGSSCHGLDAAQNESIRYRRPN